MAKCTDYKTGEKCPNFYKCEKEDEKVLVTLSKFKNLDQYCYYCKATPGVKKIAHAAQFTGNTPKWCPLGRDQDPAKGKGGS